MSVCLLLIIAMAPALAADYTENPNVYRLEFVSDVVDDLSTDDPVTFSVSLRRTAGIDDIGVLFYSFDVNTAALTDISATAEPGSGVIVTYTDGVLTIWKNALGSNWAVGETGVTLVSISAKATNSALDAGGNLVASGLFAETDADANSITNPSYALKADVTTTVNDLDISLPSEKTPDAAIDYESEEFTGLTANACYKINGADYTADAEGNIAIGSNWFGTTLLVVKAGNGTTTLDSTAQALSVPARPAAPEAGNTNETVEGKNDGKITGVDFYMEYSSDELTWTSVTGIEITGLSDGIYYLRVAATASSFSSDMQTLTIGAGTANTYTLSVTAPAFADVQYGYTQPDAQSITVISSGNTDATITSVSVSSENFKIGGSGETVPYGENLSTWTVQPAPDLSVGKYSTTITVTYNNGAAATASVSISVNKADRAAPEVTGVDQTNLTGKGKITGVDTTMEYSSDELNWSAVTSTEITDLDAGTYYVRYAETVTHNAGAITTVTITALNVLSLSSPTLDAEKSTISFVVSGALSQDVFIVIAYYSNEKMSSCSVEKALLSNGQFTTAAEIPSEYTKIGIFVLDANTLSPLCMALSLL